MALFHTSEQTMLAETVHGFLAQNAPVAHMRALRDGDDDIGFSRALWKQFAELGLSGVLIGEEHGGQGLGHVEAGIVLDAIGRNLTPSPFLSSAVGAASALTLAAPALQAQWLPKLAAAECVAALALDEAARHRPSDVQLRAERSGGGFRLNGAKRFVAYGHVADLVIVSARTAGGDEEREGLTLFAVDGRSAGLKAKPQRMVDASLMARLTFDGVELGADAVIGDVDHGWRVLAATLDAVRVGAAAELVGVAEGAMAMTLDYLRQRRQFGQPIGGFQALQHRAAQAYAEMQVARGAVRKAQHVLDDGGGADQPAMVAKGMAGSASLLAVQEGVQMHGGIGMTDAYDVGLFMKRQRVLAEMFGDADFHADQLALLSGY